MSQNKDIAQNNSLERVACDGVVVLTVDGGGVFEGVVGRIVIGTHVQRFT